MWRMQELYRDLVSYRQLADSECHPLAAELVCRLLQPECPRVLLPCRDFCQEFWSSCLQHLPPVLAHQIDCDNLPEYSCHSKPGCANELKARGKEGNICDGVVDCPDFSDETSCELILGYHQFGRVRFHPPRYEWIKRLSVEVTVYPVLWLVSGFVLVSKELREVSVNLPQSAGLDRETRTWCRGISGLVG
ncbi:hypothetical protein HPB48_003864 [Haemaphysalis longicornis]|uniref:FZ domain-containing protein n=1 Tax=Haemaphysalis longicornis TaxID=44386 RepID=A0A9J6FJT4_HAELO|nr:hypothetical protein HPB48_003864 [Haemaphysalis longicornis]